jgi:hypothetical protein
MAGIFLHGDQATSGSLKFSILSNSMLYVAQFCISVRHGGGRRSDLGGFLRQRLVARPDPDEAVPLFDRVTADAWKTAHALPWHADDLAVAAHLQSVVAAYQLTVSHELVDHNNTQSRASLAVLPTPDRV